METNIKDIKYDVERTIEGLEYILYQDLNSYSLTITANIKIGANQDKVKGTAHFLEHVVFRSSARATYKTRQKELEYRGASYNGGTSYDYTRYYITLPYTELKYGFSFLKDLILFTSFTEKEVEVERNIILDEIKKDLNDPWTQAYYTVKNNYLENNSPYKGNILGSEESIRSITITDLKEAYLEYGPKNIVLAVSGNFDNKKVKKLIEEFSSTLIKHKNNTKTIFVKTKFKKPEKVVLKPSTLTNNPIVSISTRSKGRNITSIKESITMALFQRMLAKGESSTLFSELRDKKGYLYSFGLDSLVYEDFSLESLNYECASDKFYDILNSIFKAVKKVQKTGFTEKQLEHWKTFNLNRNLISNDTHTSIGRELLWDYYYLKKTYTPKDKIEILMSIKIEEINRILRAIKPCDFEIMVLGNLDGLEASKINKYFTLEHF